MKFGIFEIPDDVAILIFFHANLKKQELLQKKLVNKEFKRIITSRNNFWVERYDHKIKEIVYRKFFSDVKADIQKLMQMHKISLHDIYLKICRLGLRKKIKYDWQFVMLSENLAGIQALFSSKKNYYLNNKTYQRFHNFSPMHLAAIIGSTTIIHYLHQEMLSCNTACKFGDGTGVSPLMLAAKYGRLDALKKLVEIGSDVNHLDSKGKGLADYAAESANVALIDYIKNDLKIASSHLVVPTEPNRNNIIP